MVKSNGAKMSLKTNMRIVFLFNERKTAGKILKVSLKIHAMVHVCYAMVWIVWYGKYFFQFCEGIEFVCYSMDSVVKDKHSKTVPVSNTCLGRPL